MRYKLMLNVANHLEQRHYVVRIPRRTIKGDNRPIHEKIIDAGNWSERDEIVRELAAQCLFEADAAGKQGDLRSRQKWLDLVQRFLRLSLHYKKEYDLDELREKLKRIEEHQLFLNGEDEK